MARTVNNALICQFSRGELAVPPNVAFDEIEPAESIVRALGDINVNPRQDDPRFFDVDASGKHAIVRAIKNVPFDPEVLTEVYQQTGKPHRIDVVGGGKPRIVGQGIVENPSPFPLKKRRLL